MTHRLFTTVNRWRTSNWSSQSCSEYWRMVLCTVPEHCVAYWESCSGHKNFTSIHTCTHTRTHKHKHHTSNIHAQTHTSSLTHADKHRHKLTHNSHTCTDSHILTDMQTYIDTHNLTCSRTHKHTYINAHPNTHIKTHQHTSLHGDTSSHRYAKI